MAEVETRELEYFVAVAEELHFGRAASRLLIAQPALSKAIRRLESRLGVELLSRSSRHVALTPAGEALLEHGRHALDAVGAAVRTARRAADPDDPLRLVLKPGGDAGLLSSLLAAYAARAADVRSVDVLFSGPADRSEFLREGRADVGLLYVPFDDLARLKHLTLLVEPRVAVLPASHRLAGKESVTLADLEGETLPRWKGAPQRDGSAAARTGLAGGDGPEVGDVVQLLQMVALGRTTGILPRSLVEPVPEGVVSITISDAPTSELVLAWGRHDTRPHVTAFVAAAAAQRTMPDSR